jgi:hypothetical protein
MPTNLPEIKKNKDIPYQGIPEDIKAILRRELISIEFNYTLSYNRFQNFFSENEERVTIFSGRGLQPHPENVRLKEWYDNWIDNNQSYYFKKEFLSELTGRNFGKSEELNPGVVNPHPTQPGLVNIQTI